MFTVAPITDTSEATVITEDAIISSSTTETFTNRAADMISTIARTYLLTNTSFPSLTSKMLLLVASPNNYDNLALGVGLGVGIPLFLLCAIFIFFAIRKTKQKKTQNELELVQTVPDNIPNDSTTKLSVERNDREWEIDYDEVKIVKEIGR